MNSVHQNVGTLSQKHTKILSSYLFNLQMIPTMQDQIHALRFSPCICKGWLLNFIFKGKEWIFFFFYLCTQTLCLCRFFV